MHKERCVQLFNSHIAVVFWLKIACIFWQKNTIRYNTIECKCTIEWNDAIAVLYMKRIRNQS